MKPRPLDQDEADLLLDLTVRLTGISRGQELRSESLIANLYRRMETLGSPDLMAYLKLVSDSEEELSHLISLVTIHTTSWFREMPHYARMETELARLAAAPGPRAQVFRLLSAACSTGEELYSFAFLLEANRLRHPEMEYQLVGVDVDPLSVRKASEGIFKTPRLGEIPVAYRRFLLADKDLPADHVEIDPAIRRRVKFAVGNLLSAPDLAFDLFDQIVCRNVLIYMNPAQIDKIILHLLNVLRPTGQLTIGHCETIDGRALNLVSLGNSSYRRPLDADVKPVRALARGNLLIIDRSTEFVEWLTPPATRHGYKVINAGSLAQAEKVLELTAPDLLLIDPDLPDGDGLRWLEVRARGKTRLPVILLSDAGLVGAERFLEALSRGGDDYINKSRLGTAHEILDRIDTLIEAGRAKAARAKESTVAPVPRVKPGAVRPRLIVLGASTGGTEALTRVLRGMPADAPPVICVQHIPVEFTLPFLERVARASGLKVGLEQRETELLPGHLYMSTAGLHIGVKVEGRRLFAYYSAEGKLAGHRPSVDFLFKSAALLPGIPVLAALLSGMGRDGAEGLLELRRAGHVCLAQDETSSAVWGMPGTAVRMNAVDYVGNVSELNARILEAARAGEPTQSRRRA